MWTISIKSKNQMFIWTIINLNLTFRNPLRNIWCSENNFSDQISSLLQPQLHQVFTCQDECSWSTSKWIKWKLIWTRENCITRTCNEVAGGETRKAFRISCLDNKLNYRWNKYCQMNELSLVPGVQLVYESNLLENGCI